MRRSNMTTAMITNIEEEDEMKILCEIQFVNEDKFEDKRSAITEACAGRYVTPHS